MKKFTLKTDSDESLELASLSLRQQLKPGDIILSGPILKNLKTKFVDIALLVTRRVLRGITHSCVYIGDGKILDIDYKPLDRGNEIGSVTVEEFVKGKLDYYGGVKIYVVRPRKYTAKHRRLVVKESVENFLRNRSRLNHTYIGSLRLGFRYIFFRNKNYKEDMSFKKSWTCGEMVAYLMKNAGAKIGKRATYTFVPPMFLSNKHFKVKSRLVMK
jgi:hypothetical protein